MLGMMLELDAYPLKTPTPSRAMQHIHKSLITKVLPVVPVGKKA